MQREVPSSLAQSAMAHIPGGVFRMGSDSHYPEEAPSHLVKVDEFWIDRTPVTNRAFAKFVNATGYVTFAEIAPDAKDYPGALPHMLRAGSLMFDPPDARGRSQRLVAMVEVPVRRQLEEAVRPGLVDQGARRSPGRSRRLLRRRGLCGLGRKGAADGSRVGVSRRAAASRTRNTPGGPSSPPAASTWPTPGRASFRTRTPRPTAGRGPRPSAPSPPMATASTT